MPAEASCQTSIETGSSHVSLLVAHRGTVWCQALSEMTNTSSIDSVVYLLIASLHLGREDTLPARRDDFGRDRNWTATVQFTTVSAVSERCEDTIEHSRTNTGPPGFSVLRNLFPLCIQGQHPVLTAQVLPMPSAPVHIIRLSAVRPVLCNLRRTCS